MVNVLVMCHTNLSMDSVKASGNSVRDTGERKQAKTSWKGPYCIHAVRNKAVYTLYNHKTGKVLKNAVNICQLTEYHVPSSSVFESASATPNYSIMITTSARVGENESTDVDENAPTSS